MAEVMSIAVTDEDQWLVANGRPIEYYAGDTAFVDGQRVFASERAARRLAEALNSAYSSVNFIAGGSFPDAVVTLPTGDRYLVRGSLSLADLGLEASDPADVEEEELVILAREMIARAESRSEGVTPAPEPAAASVS